MHAVKISLLSVLLFVLAGCSLAPRQETLWLPIDDIAIVNQHSADVLVLVTGGGYTSDQSFSNALVWTLNGTKVFSSARHYGIARYELIVTIRTVDNSPFGGESNVSSDWILRTRGGTVVWSDTVKGSGSSDTFWAETRRRVARDSAAREVIIKGVEKLSQLSL